MMSMTIVGIDHVQLAMPAGGEHLARTFYCGVLGLVEEAKPDHLAGRGGAWFRSATVRVHLGVDPAFRAATKAHPGFLIDDLDELRVRCAAAGQDAEVQEDLPGFRRLFVADPFGNRLEFLEPLKDTV